jgi:hypothetical protein
MGDGLDFNGWQVGTNLAEFNIVHDMAANYNNGGGGPACFLTANAANVLWQFNEGYACKPVVDFGTVDFLGADFDNQTSKSVGKLNYMHGNYNSGYLCFAGDGNPWDNNTFQNNYSINNCVAGNDGWGEFQTGVPSGTNFHLDHNYIFNNRAFNNPDPFAGPNQQASGMVVGNNNAGTITNNRIVVSPGNPLAGSVGRPIDSNGYASPITITGNNFFLRGGANLQLRWGTTAPTIFTDLPSWTAKVNATPGASASGNTVRLSDGPFGNPPVYPAAPMAFTAAERTLAVQALNAVLNIPGIDHGILADGEKSPGDRMASLITRLTAGDTPLTLPEFNTLGFALYRFETTPADTLLARLKSVAMSSATIAIWFP